MARPTNNFKAAVRHYSSSAKSGVNKGGGKSSGTQSATAKTKIKHVKATPFNALDKNKTKGGRRMKAGKY